MLADARAARPRCVGGMHAAPPEDRGGVGGYAHLLLVLANPRHEEHEEMLERVGEGFDPEASPIDAVNRALGRRP